MISANIAIFAFMGLFLSGAAAFLTFVTNKLENPFNQFQKHRSQQTDEDAKLFCWAMVGVFICGSVFIGSIVIGIITGEIYTYEPQPMNNNRFNMPNWPTP